MPTILQGNELQTCLHSARAKKRGVLTERRQVNGAVRTAESKNA